MSLEKHKALTTIRANAFGELFGCTPSVVFPHDTLFKTPDEVFLIDIFVYRLETEFGDIDVAVTNGMSDHRMVATHQPHEFNRRELIQYFPKCSESHARRLYHMAWLPLFDGFFLDSLHSVAWNVEGTPWKNAFFLSPFIESHREFVFEVEGDKAAFLWHIPISDEERAYKRLHGANALIDRMDAVDLPWVFDENNRPSLVE